jgi:hypothetical protein
MVNSGIPLKRISRDKKKNNHGYKLLDICKNNNLVMMNGRFDNDKIIGKMTFRNVSVIDYLITSIKGFSALKTFEILDVDNLFSDRHALLDFTTQLQ